jgi:membrane protein CcdC involved in cytochrome C biogenesis
MATGFSMFLVPAFRLPWVWPIGAFLFGAGALAYPLLLTSRPMWVNGAIMARR